MTDTKKERRHTRGKSNSGPPEDATFSVDTAADQALAKRLAARLQYLQQHKAHPSEVASSVKLKLKKDRAVSEAPKPHRSKDSPMSHKLRLRATSTDAPHQPALVSSNSSRSLNYGALTERSNFPRTQQNAQLLGSYTLLRPSNDKSQWWDCLPKHEMHELDMAVKGKKPLDLSHVPLVPLPEPNLTIEASLSSWNKEFGPYEPLLSLVEIQNHPQKTMFFFPENDITIEQKKRNHPKLFESEAVSNHVRHSLNYFSGDIFTIHRHNVQYGAARSQHETINAFRARMLKKAASTAVEKTTEPISSGRGGCPKQFMPNLVKSVSSEKEKSEAQERKAAHDVVFPNFNPEEIIGTRSDARIPGEPFTIKSAMQVIIEVKGVGFTIGTTEPFWVEMAFYDIANKTRVSETMHFEFNDTELQKSQLNACRDPQLPLDPETSAKNAIFTFSQISESVHLIVRVTRVLKGDIDAVCEPYVKGAIMSEKEKEKWITETKKTVEVLGKYRQPMAWGGIPAFTKNGKLALKEGSFCEIPLMKMKPVMTDEALYESIETGNKQQKFLDGRVVINAKTYNPEQFYLTNLVDESLYKQPVPPKNDDEGDTSKKVIDKPTLMIANLEKPSSIPENFFVNNLYIYPDTLNFTMFPAKFGKAKHILVRMCFLSSDEKGTYDKLGLKAIYGRSEGPNFLYQIDLPINWNSKRPQFYDEVKIKLPNKIDDKLHILFIFYNINTKLKKSTDKPENVLGYSLCPILNSEKRIIDDMEHVLPVYHELPANYLAPSVLQNMEQIKGDSKSPVQFTIRSKLVSSIFSQDKPIDNFFKSCEQTTVEVSVLDNLIKQKPRDLLRFFPIIFNQLFGVIHTATNNTQQIAFRTLIQLTHAVAEHSSEKAGDFSYSPYLVSYLNYHFEGDVSFSNSASVNSPLLPSNTSPLADTNTTTSTPVLSLLYSNADAPLHERLIKHWCVLRVESDLMSDVRNLLGYTMNNYPYFFFGLIVRAMTLRMHLKGDLNSPTFQTERPKFLSEECMKDLQSLIQQFSQSSEVISPMFNNHLALFFNDLFGILDRGFVLSLVHTYLSGLNSAAVKRKSWDPTFVKFQFLKILSEYEHYVPLVLPLQDKIDTNMLQQKFWKSHYLSGHILQEINDTDSSRHEFRQKSIKLLRNILWKHDMDDRYSDPEFRQNLTNIYIPHVKNVLKNLKMLKEDAEVSEHREWVVTVLYILRYCNSDLVREWLKLEEMETIKNFFDFFVFAVDAYKNPIGAKYTAQEYKMLCEISVLSLDYVEYFTQDFFSQLQREEYIEVLHRVAFLLLHLLRFCCGAGGAEITSAMVSSAPLTPTGVFNLVSYSLRNLIFKFKTGIFRYSTSPFAIELCTELLARCFDDVQTVSNASVSLIYAMFKANWEEMGEFLRMKLCLTVAASKIETNQFPLLRIMIDLIKDESNKEPSSIRKEWTLHMFDILGRLYRSAHYIQHFPHIEDPELKAEYFYNLSLETTHSIDQRVKWLNKLAGFHAEHGHMEEVGQCKVIVAALIAGLLSKKTTEAQDTSYLPQTFDAFRLVAPNIVTELPIRDESRIENTSQIFHEKGYMETLDEAIDAMVKANVFEEGVELLSILFHLHKATGVFNKLVTVGKQLNELSEKATKAIESNTRIFGKYYRIVFYGKKFGELDGQKYVYRESSSVRLVDFQSRIEKQFSSLFGEEVKCVPNKPKEELNLDPNGNFIQIISVDPFQDLERFKSKKDVTSFDKQHAVDKYGYEAPWAGPDGGKLSDEVGKQWKIRTIFVLPCAYPHVLRRMRVCDEKKVHVGPIDCAIDLIESRIEAIKLELQLRPPNTKTLQIVLSGSIMLQVNAGPKAIIQYFLHPDQVKLQENRKILQLKDKLTEFMRKCDFALKLNAALIGAEQQDYQKAMQEHFGELKKQASQYLDI